MQNQFRNTLFSKMNRLQAEMAALEHENNLLMGQEEFLSCVYVSRDDAPGEANYEGNGKWSYGDHAIYAVPKKTTEPGKNQEFYFLAVTDIGGAQFKTIREAAIFLMGAAQERMEASVAI